MPYVLVADDDDDVRTALAETLRAAGHVVVAVRDGSEALDVMEREPPRLLLLDLVMPRVGGWHVLATMRERLHLASVPVVVLTAFGALDDIPEGRTVLHKPVEPEMLCSLVDEVLSQDQRISFSMDEPPSDLLPRPSGVLVTRFR